MNEIINVIIYSKSNILESYDHVLKGEGIRVVGFSNDFTRVKAYMVLYKKAVVFVDEAILNSDMDSTFSYISERGLGILLSVERATGGTLLSRYKVADSIYTPQTTLSDIYINSVCRKIKELYRQLGLNNAQSSNDNNVRISMSEDRKTGMYQKREINVEPTKPSYAQTTNSPNSALLQKHMGKNRFSKVIAIGASTGGPETLARVLAGFSGQMNEPILIVQHMPEMFTDMFAKRMNRECAITVLEPEDGDPILGGVAYIAPGGKQMVVEESGGNFFIKVLPRDKSYVNNPAVDVLFNSVADIFASKTIAVILTGMGKDGAKGMLRIKNSGGYTIGQDEKTCIVYGMPNAAFAIGAVNIQMPDTDIPVHIRNILRK